MSSGASSEGWGWRREFYFRVQRLLTEFEGKKMCHQELVPREPLSEVAKLF